MSVSGRGGTSPREQIMLGESGDQLGKSEAPIILHVKTLTINNYKLIFFVEGHLMPDDGVFNACNYERFQSTTTIGALKQDI